MDRQFSEEPEVNNEGSASRSRMLLLVLLLLVAVAGYLYFFTDLIMPRKPAEQPKPVVQQVKQPMPKKADAVLTVQAEQKPAQAVPKAVEAPAQSPKAVSAVSSPVEKKLSPIPAKPAASNVEPPKAKQPEKTMQKPVLAKSGAVKPSRKVESNSDPKKPEKTAIKVSDKSAVKGVTAKASSAQKSTRVGECMILVGEYVLDSQLARDKEKVVKAGLEAIVTKEGKKPEPMHRLLMADYADYAGATAGLVKINAAGGQGFILEENGRYAVYAGSYFLEPKAVVEQKKLEAKGIKLTIRKVTAQVPVSQLSAGRYTSGEDAAPALKKLAKQGLKGKLVPLDGK